jgi:hypothetical protein
MWEAGELPHARRIDGGPFEPSPGRVRRTERCPDRADPLALEDGVESTAELRVTVVDQEPRPLTAIVEVHQRLRACCSIQAPFGVARAGHVLDPAAADKVKASTYSRRSKTVSTVRKSLASVVAAAGPSRNVRSDNGSVEKASLGR